ncbi:4'-phosphopantetheinyl transferase superfamily protein [Streptomyces sp. CB01881]|uniref:4'-phosphopantetheinyl transferase family protein n=1 Tax=Streptomyces sp. CB01881 TaxID=2078691 RepID=UPI0013870E64|nr:4'-phosphopantetheinyl transferase superfamily protein [Streptomyces sp. CB01881]
MTGPPDSADPVDPIELVDLVDLWVIPTDQPDAVVEALGALLDPGERARAAGPDEATGRRFTVVHGVVRLLVAERLGVHPAELAWRRGPHGKPEPAGEGHTLGVSYSASGALAVLALADGRPVGADVEEVRDPRVAARIANRYFPGAEAASLAESSSPEVLAERFTELWCRREACVKAFGGRLVQGFGLPLAGPAPLVLTGAGALGDGPCRIADAPVPGPFRAAVAAVGDRPFRLRLQCWEAPSFIMSRT